MNFFVFLLTSVVSINLWARGLQVDVAPPHLDSINKLIQIIREVEFSPEPLEIRYNPNILGNNLRDYFFKRIQSIKEYPVSETTCRPGALAFVIPNGKHEMGVCPDFFNPEVADLVRVAIMMHEARHVDGFEHVMCFSGGNVGIEGACDNRIEDKGSYAVSVEILVKFLFRYKKLSDQVRRELKLSLLETLDAFNEPVGKMGNSAVYLKNVQGESFIYDGQNLVNAPSFSGARVASRADGLVIIPEDGSNLSLIDPLSKSMNSVETESACIRRFNSTQKSLRVQFKEIVNDLGISICVEKNQIWGSIGQAQDAQIQLPGEIVQVYTAAELGNAMEQSLYVILKDKSFYRLSQNHDSQFQIQKLSRKEFSESNAARFQKLFFFQSELMGLTYSGELMRIDSATLEWIRCPGTEGVRFLSVTRPFLWAKDLVE